MVRRVGGAFVGRLVLALLLAVSVVAMAHRTTNTYGGSIVLSRIARRAEEGEAKVERLCLSMGDVLQLTRQVWQVMNRHVFCNQEATPATRASVVRMETNMERDNTEGARGAAWWEGCEGWEVRVPQGMQTDSIGASEDIHWSSQCKRHCTEPAMFAHPSLSA